MKEDLAALSGSAPAQEKGWDQAMEERLDRLKDSIGDTRQRLQGQRSRLEQLREDLTVLRGELQRTSERADAVAQALPRSSPEAPPVLESPAARREGWTAPSLVRVPGSPGTTKPRPVTRTGPVLISIAEDSLADASAAQAEPDFEPASFWPKALPYGLLLSLGLGLGLGSQRLAAAARELMEPPAAATAAPQKPILASALMGGMAPEPARPAQASEESSLADEEASIEALRLVYDYKPASSSLSVRELLGPEIVASSESEASPWVVTHPEEGIALVTFRPYGEIIENAPVYEFEVDLAAKTVRASDETSLSLRMGAAGAR